VLQNSKARDLHTSVDKFEPKSWSFCLKMFLDLVVEVEAPMFWGHCGPLHVQLFLVRSVGASLSENTFAWSHRFGNVENAINSMLL